MPLFQFELDPVEMIAPWQTDEEPSLQWFGLTLGWYNVHCNGADLLRVNPNLIARLPDWDSKSGFEDYQVARLHMDLLHALPYVLEPIPDELFRFVQTPNSARAYLETIRRLENTTINRKHLLDLPSEWYRIRRKIYSMISKGDPHIRCLSNGEFVYIQWLRNDQIEPRTGLRWNTVEDGQVCLERERFIHEVRDFHDRLMSEMESRLHIAAKDSRIRQYNFSLEDCLGDHKYRADSLDSAIKRSSELATDWDVIVEFHDTIDFELLG